MHLPHFYFQKLNFKAIIATIALILTSLAFASPVFATSDDEAKYLDCTDLKFVFARGSGVEVNSDRDFKPFKAAVDEVFGGSDYTYSFYELGSRPGGWAGFSYPAPGIGISSFERFTTSIGALLSDGEDGNYGESVETGAYEAASYLFALSKCPNTKVILAGYSQGAQVVSRTLQVVESEKFADRIFAALTFGDPKLYLPEGKMNFFTRSTAACRNENLSEYRAYVPDCYAYEGILGGRHPYRASRFEGKVKAYCQFHDVICSSKIDLDKIISAHTSYDEEGIYLRGVQDVYNMLEPATYTRPAQNVAIMVDNTGSMKSLINRYKSEAIAVARHTLSKGGKVALYTYGDLKEGRTVKLCDFDTCSKSNIETYIKNIRVGGGGDIPESLLSSSYTLMRELKWEIGANKSLVVLTDAGYHNPDRDGITLDDVVKLSKSIDPVNFYILTNQKNAGTYTELATRTDGGVYTSDIISAFSDIETEIISRDPGAIYTSTDLAESNFAEITNLKLARVSDSSVNVSFDTDAMFTIVIVNDNILGYTEEKSFTVTNLNLNKENTICLAPVSASGNRSESVCAKTTTETETADDNSATKTIIPKAPNTGIVVKYGII